MKKIILLLMIAASLFAQDDPRSGVIYIYGGDNVYAVDLDGSTEYMENISPVNLDFNDTNRVADIGRNSDFEDNATDWVDNGNHVKSIDGTSKLTGTYSLKIASSGVGDGISNNVLMDELFTVLEEGKKYTLQMQVRAVLADTDVTFVIGSKTKTFTAVDQTSEVLVLNFLATSAEVGQNIIIYLSQADDVFIDEVDLSQVYDYSWFIWAKVASGASGTNTFFSYQPQRFQFSYRVGSGIRMNIVFGVNLSSTVNVDMEDDDYHLVGLKLDRVGEFFTVIFDGDSVHTASASTTTIGVIPKTVTLIQIARRTSEFFEGNLGEFVIYREYTSTSSDQIRYNRGRAGKHFIKTGTEVGWWQFKGNNNIKFLSDETDNNDLTGVNITRNDQLKLKKYKD